MAQPAPLSAEECHIIEKLRWLRGRYANFTLKVYGQGSPTRCILDMAWEPRVRLTLAEPISLAVDD